MGGVGDDVDDAAGAAEPGVLELTAAVDPANLAVGASRWVVDDDVTVGPDARDHDQMAGRGRDRSPREGAAPERDRGHQRDTGTELVHGTGKVGEAVLANFEEERKKLK